VFWGEAVTTAVYLLNRSFSKSIQGKTPDQLWTGSAPNVSHLRTFGCIAHVKVNTPHLRKLDDRSRKMVFVGYELGSKAYKVYDPTTRRVHISQDVVFNESTQWTWSAEHGGEPRDFTMEELTPVEADTVTTTISTVPRTTYSTATRSASPTSLTTPLPNQYMAGTPAQGSAPATSSLTSSHGLDFASPQSSSLSEQLDNDHDGDVPLRFCRIDNVT